MTVAPMSLIFLLRKVNNMLPPMGTNSAPRVPEMNKAYMEQRAIII